MVKTPSVQFIFVVVLFAIAIALSFSKMEAIRVGETSSNKMVRRNSRKLQAITVRCETDQDCLESQAFLQRLVKGHCILQGSAVGFCEPL
ncbi:hypothetical protein ACH5RR_036448 [Cinchona calisaya]|uniref:Uncharacterized protein n=1 Tax=Cinchona calisaya TaxID=153742 RepID=A0ABD2Y6T0_9GENT